MLSDREFSVLTARLDEIVAALRLMIATQHTHTEILTKLLEAAAPGEESDGLGETMRRIAEGLKDQTAALERVEAQLGGLGTEIEAGVVRGLAQALGAEEAEEDGREGEGTAEAAAGC